MLDQRALHHIALTNQRLNSQTPINRLPDELLVKIFVITLAVDLPRDYLSGLVSLQLVSKDWNRIFFEIPSLWAQISTSYSDRANRAAILRSKESSLRVDYHDLSFMGRNGRENSVAFVDVVSREAYRWRSAEFHVRHKATLDLLHSLILLSVPRLEELIIDCYLMDEELQMGESIDIFSGGANHLRHIQLENFPIPWRSQLLSQLETLKISGSRRRPGPSTSEIADILRRCPELRTFQLEYHGDGEIPISGTTLSELEAVHLPLLKSFTLKLDNAEAFNRIISSVRIPACRKLHLKSCHPTGSIFSPETSHLTTLLLSRIQLIPRISMVLSTRALILTGCHGEGKSDIYIYHSSPWEDLARLTEDAIGSVLWPPIDLSIICADSLPFTLASGLLRRMTSITRLKLRGNSDQYITYLSYPTINNGIHEWVLPNLRELSLESCPDNSLNPLKDLSSKRQEGADIDRRDGVLLGLPTKLEDIHVAMTYLDGRARMGPLYTALWELKGEDWDGHMFSQ
ncbi:hypothetical protein FRB94_011587 [Tulasnella sp. JGI-2019a]|nr:hypothetical protein FRB94_011587 [Tulasnella sp. JGI-2019a]